MESKAEIRKFDNYQKMLEEYLSLSDKVLAAEKLVLLDLQYSNIFYSAQNEDAKKVAQAYRIYGKKVKMVEKAVLEKILNFPEPSPTFSPTDSAPSPSLDSDDSQKSAISGSSRFSKTRSSIEGSITDVIVDKQIDKNMSFIDALSEKTKSSANESLSLTITHPETIDKKMQIDEDVTESSIPLEEKSSKLALNFSFENISSILHDTSNSFIPFINNFMETTESEDIKPKEEKNIEILPSKENLTVKSEAIPIAKEHLPLDETKSINKKEKAESTKSISTEKDARKEESVLKIKPTTDHKSVKKDEFVIKIKSGIEEKSVKKEESLKKTKLSTEEKNMKKEESVMKIKPTTEEKSIKKEEFLIKTKPTIEERSVKKEESVMKAKSTIEEKSVKKEESVMKTKSIIEEKSVKKEKYVMKIRSPIEEKSVKKEEYVMKMRSPIEGKSVKKEEYVMKMRSPIEGKNVKKEEYVMKIRSPIEEKSAKKEEFVVKTKPTIEEKIAKKESAVKTKQSLEEEGAKKTESSMKYIEASISKSPDTFVKSLRLIDKNMKEMLGEDVEQKCFIKTELDIYSTKNRLQEVSDVTLKSTKAYDKEVIAEENLSKSNTPLDEKCAMQLPEVKEQSPAKILNAPEKSVSSMSEKVAADPDVQDDIDFLLETAYDKKVKSKTNFKRKIDNLLKLKQSKSCKLSEPTEDKILEENAKNIFTNVDIEKDDKTKYVPASVCNLPSEPVKLMETANANVSPISKSLTTECVLNETKNISDKNTQNENICHVSEIKGKVPAETIVSPMENIGVSVDGSETENASPFIPFGHKSFPDINTELLQSILNRHKDNMNLAANASFALSTSGSFVSESAEPSLPNLNNKNECSGNQMESMESSTSIPTEQVVSKDITHDSNIDSKYIPDLEDKSDNVQNRTPDIADKISPPPPNFAHCIQTLLSCLTNRNVPSNDSCLKHSSSIPLENTLQLYNCLMQTYSKEYSLKEQPLNLNSFSISTQKVDSIVEDPLQQNSNVQDAIKPSEVKENATLNDNLEVMDMDVDSEEENT